MPISDSSAASDYMYIKTEPLNETIVPDYKIYTGTDFWTTTSGSGYINYASKIPTDEWQTPYLLYDAIDKVCNFDLDVCASDTYHTCSKYYTKEQDGLTKEWSGSCWLNQSTSLERWVRKAYESKTNVVCLVPARTDTKWWQRYAAKATVIFIEGRLRLYNNARLAFPSAILVFPPVRAVALDILCSIKNAGYNGYISC